MASTGCLTGTERRGLILAWAMLLAVPFAARGEVGSDPLHQTAQLRRPVALVEIGADRWAVANRDAGSVSLVDVSTRRVLSETRCGKQLADLISLGQQHLLAVDQAQHQLLLLALQADAISVVARVRVPQYPVKVVLAADGQSCLVASLWSQRLSRVELVSQNGSWNLRVAATLDLPFAPRELLLLPKRERLLVADSHGGMLGFVDLPKWKLDLTRELPAHNIRGLAISPDGNRLMVAHQIIIDVAQTTHNDVHWGVLMSNVLRWLDLDVVMDPQRKILADSHVHLAGDTLEAGEIPQAWP